MHRAISLLKMELDLKTLLRLLSVPTAPFREQRVIDWALEYLKSFRLPFFRDSSGNIVVGAASNKTYRALLQSRRIRPLPIFIAHMDHPGFHGITLTKNKRLKIQWHGGSPTKHLVGARVWVTDSTGPLLFGVLKKARLNKHGSALAEGEIELPKSFSLDPSHVYGGFAFKSPAWKEGQVIYTKAADDLVGCFAVLTTAVKAFERKLPFVGLLTRAEEVGFIGTLSHFAQGFFEAVTQPFLFVSLETSRTLPGAHIGKGPVVRQGDRATTFDPHALEILRQVADRQLPGKYQRRVMDGGTCEATVAISYGQPTVGISIPLGNYHNQSFEGGPGSRGKLGPAPEFVHLEDIKGMLSLMEGLLTLDLPWQSPWTARKHHFAEQLKKYQPLLEG